MKSRVVAHIPTGFPLFVDSWYPGFDESGITSVRLIAESFTFADSSIAPVPVEDIPTAP